MLDRSRRETSNPLATVEEIQRRLLRPSSRSSPTSTCTIRSQNPLEDDPKHSHTSQKGILCNEEAKEIETARKKLEDYLDPVLLSAISSKMKFKGEVKLTVSKDFEWPAEELKPFMDASRAEKRGEWSDGVVNLNDDLNEDVGEDEEEEACSPFRQFEKTVIEAFQGVKD